MSVTRLALRMMKALLFFTVVANLAGNGKLLSIAADFLSNVLYKQIFFNCESVHNTI